MSTTLAVIIVLEVAILVFVVWGFIHEDKFIAFEDKILYKIRKKIKEKKREICASYLAKQGIVIPRQKGDV